MFLLIVLTEFNTTYLWTYDCRLITWGWKWTNWVLQLQCSIIFLSTSRKKKVELMKKKNIADNKWLIVQILLKSLLSSVPKCHPFYKKSWKTDDWPKQRNWFSSVGGSCTNNFFNSSFIPLSSSASRTPGCWHDDQSSLIHVHIQVDLCAQVEVEKGVDAENKEEDCSDDQECILSKDKKGWKVSIKCVSHLLSFSYKEAALLCLIMFAQFYNYFLLVYVYIRKSLLSFFSSEFAAVLKVSIALTLFLGIKTLLAGCKVNKPYLISNLWVCFFR